MVFYALVREHLSPMNRAVEAVENKTDHVAGRWASGFRSGNYLSPLESV
jgi:hypothetical protein